jgi:hypothetical protein
MVRVDRAVPGDAPLLGVDQLHGRAVSGILDTVDIVPCLAIDPVHASKLPARAVVSVGHVARNGRHALRKVQVVVRYLRDVVASAATVHTGLHVPVGIVGIAGGTGKLVIRVR